MTEPLDQQTRQLAAMTYGEASPKNDNDEMYAIASVLVRQRDARGYKDIATFASNDRTFSFVVKDGNDRYKKLMKATGKEIAENEGMTMAMQAAVNALGGGPDKSNGAYFWDGADIKKNYKHHAKVINGIKFSDKSHNIYSLKESTKVVIVKKITKKKNAATGKLTTTNEEVGRFDHVYESTAAYGGTIFWKISQHYIDVMHAKEYK